MANNFPVSDRIKRDLNWLKYSTSNRYYKIISNLGALGNIAAGGTSGLAWKTQTKPTITANSWVTMSAGNAVGIGRSLYINKISIETTDACQIGYRIYERYSSDMLNTFTGALFISGTFADNVKSINSSTGGIVEYNFDEPIKLKYGQEISFYYSMNAVVGTNWQISIQGYDVTNDENLNAELMFGIIGDSICIVADTNEIEYGVNRSSGAGTGNSTGTSIHGTWGMITKKYLEATLGKQILYSNLGLGGTSTLEWENRVTMGGLFKDWRPDYLNINLGMNDCASFNLISSTNGVDGIFKKAYKNILLSYFESNPSGKCVVNQVTDSDTATRTVLISVVGHLYNGLTYIQAIRQEVISLVNEFKISYPSYSLALADTSPANTYTATVDTATYPYNYNYLVSECFLTGGAFLHPNTKVGQPKMAVKIKQAWDTLI